MSGVGFNNKILLTEGCLTGGLDNMADLYSSTIFKWLYFPQIDLRIAGTELYWMKFGVVIGQLT